MASKVNLKAKIERHSRVLKHNLSKANPFISFYHKLNYNVVLFLVLFLFPIYPSFSSFLYENTPYDFYRGDIDESTILDSYTEDDSGEDISIISNDSYLSINNIISGSRDLSGYTEVINYEVKPGDSFSSIAYKFGISINSIIWANNFNSKTVLKPGQIIKIPPVSGLLHEVKSGDTISDLAKKYKVSEEKILAQNGLKTGDKIKEGQILIIPGAIKETPLKTDVLVQKDGKKTQKTKKEKYYSFISGGKSEFVDEEGIYKMIKRKPKWNFYWGNCTRYVAQYKNVDWSGDAKDWLENARNAGHPTGNTPEVGAIVVFHGKGYNPVYGHVGIVIDVKEDSIIVKDMNYRRLNEVTVRKVPIKERAIKGYIYVD